MPDVEFGRVRLLVPHFSKSPIIARIGGRRLMAMRMAILDWNDVQSLVGVCSQSFAASDPQGGHLETARHRLVESLHVYLQEWQPGRVFDDAVRIQLVGSLEKYSDALLDAGNPKPEVQSECLRIADMIRSAIESDPGI